MPAVLTLLLATGLFASCDAEVMPRQDKKDQDVETRLVNTILTAEYRIQEKQPPNLVVSVVGQVPTGGYTNIKLVRVEHKEPPKDGIQEYRLVATPPNGPAIQVISEVKASDTWKDYGVHAPWIKGIRILGKDDGIKVVRFDDK